MKIVTPFPVTDANLVSNVAESDAPAYNPLTTYALGDLVVSGHRVYQSLAGSNLGNPVTDATKWLDTGPTNRFAMFDTVNGTATANSAGIDAAVTVVGGRANCLAMFNLIGSSVQVTSTTDLSGTIYDETYSLVATSGILSWYDYFFEPITYRSDLIVTDMPLDSSPTIRVQLAPASGVASCGTMVVGQISDIGGTFYGARAGIQDYSKKEVDDFGNYVVVPRSYAKRLVARLMIDNGKVDSVYQALAALRVTPCVWIGADDYTSTASLGFWKDFAVEISYPTKSLVSIEIEGLT